MIAYPKELPYPLREGYGFEQTNNISRTEMASGRSRQRVEFKNAPSMVQLSWLFNSGQAALFEYWSSQMVGAGWFSIRLLSPLGFDKAEVRFSEVPRGPVLVGVSNWKFTAVCELRKRPLLPAGWAENAPGYVVGSGTLDVAINKEWPTP